MRTITKDTYNRIHLILAVGIMVGLAIMVISLVVSGYQAIQQGNRGIFYGSLWFWALAALHLAGLIYGLEAYLDRWYEEGITRREFAERIDGITPQMITEFRGGQPISETSCGLEAQLKTAEAALDDISPSKLREFLRTIALSGLTQLHGDPGCGEWDSSKVVVEATVGEQCYQMAFWIGNGVKHNDLYWLKCPDGQRFCESEIRSLIARKRLFSKTDAKMLQRIKVARATQKTEASRRRMRAALTGSPTAVNYVHLQD